MCSASGKKVEHERGTHGLRALARSQFYAWSHRPRQNRNLQSLPPGDENERALSDAMMNYFTEFARSGTPAASGEPAWKPYKENTAFLDFRETPQASSHLLPGTYELHEEIVARRRAAGTQNWFVNIGLASPVVPPAAPSTPAPASNVH